MNGTSLPEELDITVKTSELDGKANIIDLVRTPRMRIRSINMCFNWFVNGMVYYGLSLNTSNLGGNPYVNAAISAAVEIPGYLGVILVLNRVGRRLSLLVSLLVGGAALLATCTIPPHLNFISIALAMTGKFFVTCSFAFIYLYSAEIFPTVVRNVAIGCASLCARMGALLAPYIAQLSDTSRFIPLITFGTLAIAAGGLSLLFPETKGNILPETVEDAENFGRHKKKNQRDVEMKEPHLRKSILSANEEAVQTIY